MQNKTRTFEDCGKSYRVIDTAPSGKYLLAQWDAYPANGRFSASADDPIALFCAGAQPVFVAETVGPFALEDGPFLFDVVWHDAYVALFYAALDRSEMKVIHLSFPQ